MGLACANQSMPEGEAVAFAAVQVCITGANCCQVCQPSSLASARDAHSGCTALQGVPPIGRRVLVFAVQDVSTLANGHLRAQ